MELIATSIRIPVKHDKVLEAITTTAGHRGWWADDCEVGRAVGEEAVYRFDAVEVVFRIDRIDARGIEMTCVRDARSVRTYCETGRGAPYRSHGERRSP